MQYTEIMVRYGELSTKGKNRNDFIGRLNGNVTKALHEYKQLRIHPKRDRMHIILNGDDAEGLSNVCATFSEFKTFHQVLKLIAI